MIRALVVDDSAVVRAYVVELLREGPEFEVVGEARDGLEAVELAERLKPDVILMDAHMPRMDGYEATRRIMERAPTPIVMMSASIAADEAALSFRALEAGALTIVEKPAGLDHPQAEAAARQLRQTLRLMTEVKVIRRWSKRAPPGVPPTAALAPGRRVEIVAIGASTGGPQVLAEILAALPSGFPAPILIVQHIAAGFVQGLASWLGQQTKLRVKLADAGEPLRPDTVYVARDGFQLGVTRERRIGLTSEPGQDGFCPSASSLFLSVAEGYGRSAVGILLTGMGRDGAAGLARLRAAGGLTIAQSEPTCVVFGMPGEAVRLGAAQHVLSPPEIGGALRSLTPGGGSPVRGG